MAKSKYFSDEPEAPPPAPPEPVAEATTAGPVAILKGANAPGKVPPSLKGTSQDPTKKKPEAAKKKGD